MIVLGLTGSLGMGKSTASAMLERLGIPVHDADAEVHNLLCYDSPAWPALAAAFPYFQYPQIYGKKWSWRRWWDGFSPWWRHINRQALGKIVFAKEEEREKLETILHPLVQQAQVKFIDTQRSMGRKMVALDIPLLFETGAEARVDYTITVSAPLHIQQARALERPGMDIEKFKAVLARQMPDGEKCARSDFVVHSGLGHAQMMKELKMVVAKIRKDRAADVSEEAV